MRKFVLILLSFLVLTGCSEQEKGGPASQVKSKYIPVSRQDIDLRHAKGYRIIDCGNTGFPGRERVECSIIAPLAKDHLSFAQTAIQAAIDLQKKTRAHVSTIYLSAAPELIGTGDNLAIAHYAIDGGGFSGDQDWRWDVEAAESPIPENQIKTAILWRANRELYQTRKGTDEVALREFIAKELAIDLEQAHLPMVILEKYPINSDPENILKAFGDIRKFEKNETVVDGTVYKYASIYLTSRQKEPNRFIRDIGNDAKRFCKQASLRWGDEFDALSFQIIAPNEDHAKSNSYNYLFGMIIATQGLTATDWENTKYYDILNLTEPYKPTPQGTRLISAWCTDNKNISPSFCQQR